jgi:hypothetical protein
MWPYAIGNPFYIILKSIETLQYKFKIFMKFFWEPIPGMSGTGLARMA